MIKAEEPAEEPDQIEEESSEQDRQPRRPRIPPPDPEAREQGRRYLLGGLPDRLPPLAVTIADGPITARSAPAELVFKIGEKIDALLKDMGGGVRPALLAVTPTNSMTLLFGDADFSAEQEQLPVGSTEVQAERIADMINLEGDELFARARQIGAPVKHYIELTKVLQSEGVTLKWAVRDQEPRILTPTRAQQQHARLSEPPPTREYGLVVNGVLYRVITENRSDDYLGSVGIRLHTWSSRPPGSRRTRIFPVYETREVEAKIKDGLIGEPVTAHLLIRQPVPEAAIDPERYDLILDDIEPGPPEGPAFGPSFFDEIDSEGDADE